jgi:hypothetical protein
MVTTWAGGIDDEKTPARRGLERGDERRTLICAPFSRVRADLTPLKKWEESPSPHPKGEKFFGKKNLYHTSPEKREEKKYV